MTKPAQFVTTVAQGGNVPYIQMRAGISTLLSDTTSTLYDLGAITELNDNPVQLQAGPVARVSAPSSS